MRVLNRDVVQDPSDLHAAISASSRIKHIFADGFSLPLAAIEVDAACDDVAWAILVVRGNAAES